MLPFTPPASNLPFGYATEHMFAPGIFTTPNRKMPPNSRKGVIQHKPGQFFILYASRVSPLSQIRQITNQRGNFGSGFRFLTSLKKTMT
jgi:hypothetical protein